MLSSSSWKTTASAAVITATLCVVLFAIGVDKIYPAILFGISFSALLFSLFQLKTDAEINENVSVEIAKELFWQANHDSETGILNLKAIYREIEKHTSEATDGSADSFMHGVLRIDIDNFVVVKKTFGSDAVLSLKRQIAQFIETYVEPPMVMAVAGERGFAIFIPNCDERSIRDLIKKILLSTRDNEFNWQNKALPIAISIGWATITDSSSSPSSILNRAEIACIRASQKGGNNAEHYQAPSSRDLSEIDIVSKVNRALKEDNFILFHQRIFKIGDSKTPDERQYFTEVLIRMEDNGIPMSPGLFLPIAEKFNLMTEIDKWVIKNTFEFISRNRDLPEVRNCTYAINLSGASLNNEEIYSFTEDALKRYEISPSQISFEITESVAIQNLHHAAYLVGYLKRLGCQVALDDFGTGVSSFEYLKYLPIDKLKLDGAFVKNLTTDKIDYEIIKAISNVCKALNIELVAEFVENKETLIKLSELGIDYAQGYFLHRPAELTGKTMLSEVDDNQQSFISDIINN